MADAYTEGVATHQFIEHNQQTHAGQVDGVAVPGDDELTHPFGLQAGPSRRARDRIRKSACGKRQWAVDDGDVRKRLGGDVVELPAYFGLERGLRRWRVEDLRARNFDGGSVLDGEADVSDGGWRTAACDPPGRGIPS